MTYTTRTLVIGAVLLCAGAFAIGAVSGPVTVPGPSAVNLEVPADTRPAPETVSEGATSGVTVPVDLNIVALLDLSDRVSTDLHSKQADKDKKILRDLVDLFEARVRRQLFVASRDRLRIAIARQEGSGYDPSEFADALTIDMRAIFSGGKPAFDKARARLLSTIDQLYAAATTTVHYTGANIPLFFRDHLAGYLDTPERGRSVRNVLLVLTDGYIELDRKVKASLQDDGHRTVDMRLSQFRARPDWERVFDEGDHGLIVPEQGQCNRMDVFVMEINLDPRHLDDKPLLFKYWRKWLDEMGCGRTELNLTEDASSQTSAALRRFLATQ